MILDANTFRELEGVDKLISTHLRRPRCLGRIGVDGNNTRSTDELGCVNNTQSNSTDTKDSDRGALCDIP